MTSELLPGMVSGPVAGFSSATAETQWGLRLRGQCWKWREMVRPWVLSVVELTRFTDG